jgi:hypothetical protein
MFIFSVFVLEADGKGSDGDPESVPNILRAQAVQEVSRGRHLHPELLPNLQRAQRRKLKIESGINALYWT